MNITLTGNLGSGKTTICNILKERGYENFTRIKDFYIQIIYFLTKEKT